MLILYTHVDTHAHKYAHKYSLASGIFPQIKFCDMWKINNELKTPFSQKILFDKYLKFKEINYFIHYVNFEIMQSIFFVKSLDYFQKWNSNGAIAFLNSSLDSKFCHLNFHFRGHSFMTYTRRWRRSYSSGQ